MRLAGNADGNTPFWQIHPDPAQLIAADGALFTAEFSHPLLARSELEPIALRCFSPTCSLSYAPKTRTLRFSQSGSEDDLANLDALALGQLALGQPLCPLLRPRFGFVDECSDDLNDTVVLHEPLARSAEAGSIPYIFWANFFGSDLVQKHGHSFFLNAPGWKKQELTDGGVFHVGRESYTQWWTDPSHEVQEYFRRRFPTAAIYNTQCLIAGASSPWDTNEDD